MPSIDSSRWEIYPDGSRRRRKPQPMPDIDLGLSSLGAAHPPMMIEATEAAAKLAEELAVNLSTVQGTGKDGKITKADVEAAAV